MTNLHEMHQGSINRAVGGEQVVARDAVSSAQWRWSRPNPIIQEQTKISQTQRRTGARAAMELTKLAVSGPQGALDASITSARLHQTC